MSATRPREPCAATMESRAVPGHVHGCTGGHADGDDHYCGECGRRWWRR